MRLVKRKRIHGLIQRFDLFFLPGTLKGVAGVYKREIGRFVDRALIASIVCSTFLKICPIGRQNRLINDINQKDYSIEMKTSVPFSL